MEALVEVQREGIGALARVRWIRPPLGFLAFVKLIGHKLTPYQKQKYTEFLPVTPEELFLDRKGKNNETLFLWGKGSGKDYTASLYLAWVAYLLTSGINLRKYIGSGYPLNMPIHLVAVATTFAQSQEVLYAYLAPLMSQNPELFSEWRITKEFATHTGANVRILALHSKANSWEGLNPLVWVMDEASGYPEGNADSVYDVLRTSAITRYGNLYTGIIMSYPRFASTQVDFSLNLYERITKGEITTISADRAPTWVVRGQDKSLYDAEYEHDFVGASLRLECVPLAAEDAYFDPTRFRFAGSTELDIERPAASMLPTGVYSIGIDAGFERDCFGIAVARSHGNVIRVVGLQRYKPKEVNSLEVLSTLKTLQGVLGCPVYGDTFNAKLFSTYLHFVEKPITRTFYKNEYAWFRKMLYEGTILLPKEGAFVEEFKEELFSVFWRNGSVRHPPNGSKDLLDAVVMACIGLKENSGGNVYSI
jgi:hypothetical protein